MFCFYLFPVLLVAVLAKDHRLEAMARALEHQLPFKNNGVFLAFFVVIFTGDLFFLNFCLATQHPVAYLDKIAEIRGVLDDDLNPKSAHWSEAMAYVKAFLPSFGTAPNGVLMSLVHIRLLWLHLLYEYLQSLSDKKPEELAVLVRVSLDDGKKSADARRPSFRC